MRILALIILTALTSPLWVQPAAAHCEIPCGIYDDEARFKSMLEHATTIEKSMMEIDRLSNESPANYHMIARWTVNKEEHAQELQDIVSVYFLTQRVKTPDPDDSAAWADYVEHTTLLHQLLVAAMKCKQTTDLANVEKVRDLVAEYKAHYFKDHGHD